MHRSPITREEFTRLIAGGETQTVEFKERIRDSRMLASIIGAMANTAGGQVFVGVREPSSIVGIDPPQLDRLYESALRHVRPRPATSLQFLDVDGKMVGVIEIERARELVVSGEGALVREGAGIRPMQLTAIAAYFARHPRLSEADQQALAESLADLTARITELTLKLDRANSIRGQLPNYIIGGAIGAIFGWLLAK
jgi:predicted HTH transcriptional regulator